MPIGRRVQMSSSPTTETEAPQQGSERVTGWLRVPLIVAALLAIPVIVVQESDLGGFWEALAAVLDWAIWGCSLPMWSSCLPLSRIGGAGCSRTP